MTSFDLANQPWIPVRFHGESQPRDVSIREALARAPDIAELTDPSPLVTIALHRLLLAICHRVWGPDSEAAWQQLWQAKSFDAAALDVYLGRWKHRFDLFDEERPFYQTPGLPSELSLDLRALAHESAIADLKPTLFDHAVVSIRAASTFGDAARMLIAHHLFARGGTITPVPPATKYAKSGPLYKGVVLLAVGASLAETLMLNLVVVNGDQGEPWEFSPVADQPAWERDEPAAVATRNPVGYLDYLTWQTRRIRLVPPSSGDSTLRCVIGVGEQLANDDDQHRWVQMVAYKINEGAKPPASAHAPIQFRPERSLWRDSAALFGTSLNYQSPRTFRLLRTLAPNLLYQVSAFGLWYDPRRIATVDLMRRDNLPVPVRLLQDPDLGSLLDRSVATAEATGRALRTASWAMASEALAPDGSADRDRVSALADSLAVERSYWPALDAPFRKFMVELAATYLADSGIAAEETWAMNIRTAATNAFELAAGALENGSRGYRAAAIQRPRFRAALAAALRPLMPPVQEVST